MAGARFVERPGAVEEIARSEMVREGLRRPAEAIADEAERSHPWVSRSGDTEASIGVEDTPDGPNVVAGGASAFLEFGTVNMAPFPFIRAASARVVPGGRR